MNPDQHALQARDYLASADLALNRDAPSHVTITRAERVADATMYGTLALAHAALALVASR